MINNFKMLALLTALVVTSTGLFADNMPYSQSPPGGLKVEQCPMFVCFGFDDNSYPDGIKWFRELVKNKKNKDGTPVRATFFCTGSYGEKDPAVLAEWKLLAQDGHEIGNHTWSHPHGRPQTLDQWKTEITQTTDYLKKELGVADVKGFRTPFLEPCQNTFDALKSVGMYYDCTIEAGYGSGWNGDGTGGVWWWSMAEAPTRKALFWPHTLDNGTIPPTADATQVKNIKSAGLWEIPVYTHLKSTGGELGGFDFNLWKVMSKDDFYKTLKFNFDQQFSGNRCPISINAHTDYYSEFNNDANTEFTQANFTQRKEAMEEFLAYVLAIPEVRVVPFIKLIEWMKNPTPIGPTSISSYSALKSIDDFSIKTATTKSIEFSPLKPGLYAISIVNAQGRNIYQTMLQCGKNRISTGSPLSVGAYYIHINDGKNSVVRKTIVVR